MSILMMYMKYWFVLLHSYDLKIFMCVCMCVCVCLCFHLDNTIWGLTHTQLETHVCAFSTVVTDALVLNHQAITIHSADLVFLYRPNMYRKQHKKEIKFWKKWPSC